uniref:DUF295 domain-containing protein n=1 Tax=Heterorhabditis bacteriophora TaxID=37862 RepID=A0A1I7XJA2_HETBA
MESSLNDRRKIMYTDVRMRDMYNTLCELPYEQHHLRPFDYRTFHGYDRHDFVMLYDYANSLLEFDRLTKSEKNLLFRYSCGVDCMINSAYYTSRMGMADSRLILFNAEFVPMDPLPIYGDGPGDERLFASKEDHAKYKCVPKYFMHCFL